MELKWLFLDLNSYFASVEQVEDPRLRNRPVAVVPMLADTTCCLAASYEAKACGIKTGTSLKEAKERCPEIVFIEADHRKYVEYHDRVVEVVESCIPVTKVMSIDEVACELMGRERQESVAVELAKFIKRRMAEEISPFLKCSIGIASNCLLAKVASDMQKPDGLTVIDPEKIFATLRGLKIRDFPGIGARMEERFFAKGCYTMDQLYALSQDEMRHVWGGVVGERFWEKIRGREVLEPETVRRSVSHSHVLPPDSRDRDQAWFVTVHLLYKAAVRLRSLKLNAKEVRLMVRYMTRSKEHAYFETYKKLDPTQDTLVMTRALTEMWEGVRKQQKILQVAVALNQLESSKQRQLSLFEAPKTSKLMSTLDRINEKYGKTSLYLGPMDPGKKPMTPRIAFHAVPKVSEFD